MSSPIFYIFDNKRQTRLPVGIKEHNPKIILCPLTTDVEVISSVERSLKSQFAGEIEIISYLKLFHQNAFNLKGDFLQFISQFASRPLFNDKNLKEFFKYSFMSFSLWWTSLVAEKNPVKSNAYKNLVTVLTILDIYQRNKCQEMWVNLLDQDLACVIIQEAKDKFVVKNFRKTWRCPNVLYFFLHLINGLMRYVIMLAKAVYAKGHLSKFKARKDILKRSRYILVTYFPFLEESKVQENMFINKLYGPLQETLEKKYSNQMSWLAMSVQTKEHGFKESVQLGKKWNEAYQNFYFLDEYMSATDLLRLPWLYLFVSLKFLSKVPVLENEFIFPKDRLKIFSLFRLDWFSSFCGARLMEGLCYYFLYRNFFKNIPEGSTVLYFAEMQAWEKACLAAGKEVGRSRFVGIQHTIVSLLHLMYFDYHEDLEKGDYIQKMPRPNFLGCVGNISKGHFENSGWDKEKLFILGPIRFQHFKERIKSEIPWEKKRNRIVVALPISRLEGEELLRIVFQAFQDEKNLEIIIKAHPFCPIDSILKSLHLSFDDSTFEITDTPLSELLKETKILIVSESSATLDGLSEQCRIVIPTLASVVDMNPLAGVSDLPVYVENPKELSEVVKELLSVSDQEDYYKKCKRFLEEYCSFFDREGEILTRLEHVLDQSETKSLETVT